MKKISIVVPIFNEETNIPLFFNRLLTVKNKFSNYDWEVIFVNDGSSDNSEKIIKEMCRLNKYVKLVNLSRNFGHQEAISAGIDYSTGDAVISIDGDLQDPPELCVEIIAEWEKGFDIVYAKRRSRKDSFFKKTAIYLFYRVQKKITDLDIAMDTGDFRLMDRRAINEMKRCREKNRFIRGLVAYVGFKSAYVFYDRDGRLYGKSGYSFKKLMKLAMDGLIGFSEFPLKLIFFFGIIIFFLSLIGAAAILLGKLFLPAFPLFLQLLIVASVFFIGGVQMIVLGILGEYIGRIYIEIKNRPLYVVKEQLNFNEQR